MSNYDADIVGIDLETGGLDGYQEIEGVGRVHGAMHYPIIEMAFVVPLVEEDGTLNLEQGDQVVIGIHLTEESRARCHSWALEQHEQSGLLERLKTGEGFDYVADTTEEAEEYIIEWLKAIGVRKFYRKDSTGAMVYGNNVGFDMNFINAQMPKLYEYFSYRKMDVSSVNVLSRTPIWQSLNLPQPDKKLAHTALADITETTDELNAYTKSFPVLRDLSDGELAGFGPDLVFTGARGKANGS